MPALAEVSVCESRDRVILGPCRSLGLPRRYSVPHPCLGQSLGVNRVQSAGERETVGFQPGSRLGRFAQGPKDPLLQSYRRTPRANAAPSAADPHGLLPAGPCPSCSSLDYVVSGVVVDQGLMTQMWGARHPESQRGREALKWVGSGVRHPCQIGQLAAIVGRSARWAPLTIRATWAVVSR